MTTRLVYILSHDVSVHSAAGHHPPGISATQSCLSVATKIPFLFTKNGWKNLCEPSLVISSLNSIVLASRLSRPS